MHRIQIFTDFLYKTLKALLSNQLPLTSDLPTMDRAQKGQSPSFSLTPSVIDRSKKTDKIPLTRLLRRSFLRTALIPLVAVEVVLVIAFLVTHQISTSSQVAVQRVDAQENLVRLVQSRADILTQELNSVVVSTETYQRQTVQALATPAQPSIAEKSRYVYTSEGAFVTTHDTGGAAAFYSNLTTIRDRQLQQIWRTARLDSLMKDLVEAHPLITQIYFNSFDSYNRIYPYFDTAKQYTPDLNIPTYSFYYLADSQHNPTRQTVWTDSYLDPAGQGWMVSCIAPVYQGDFLAGVVGSDITLEVLINQVLSNAVPWNGYALLLAKDGTILTLPPAAEQEWGLREKTNHSYTDYVREDTFKPEEFNLFRRPDLQAFSQAVQQNFSSFQALELGEERKLAAWSHIPDTDWTYLVIVPEQEVFARTQELGRRLLLIGKVIILGMAIFYTLFLIYLWRSGNRMSRQVAEPLQEIEKLVNAIAAGNYNQPNPAMQIVELDHTATQVVDMGKTLGERTEALVNALKVKSDFLGIISHELRTPMNGILGMGDLLRLTHLNSVQREHLDTMMLSGENLLRLLNDILDMSKLEAKKLTLAEEPFDMTQFVQQKAVLWQPRFEQRSLTFHWELDPNVPQQVVADCERIRQMVNNYLNNALKFTPTGQVCFKVKRANTPLNPIINKTNDRLHFNLRFEVIDTGIGISAPSLSQLFRPFSQVDNSLQRSYEGAGLGLSIVKELAELMGGTVGADSLEGKGSTFWFEIPVYSVVNTSVSSPTPSPPASPLPVPETRSLTILLAEDNKVNQKFAGLCLKQIGLTCDIASNGQEAIDLYAQHPYDVVLMDIHMPEVDGITAMHGIRQINPDAIVIAVTADALPEVRDRLIGEGFNDYLSKPFRLNKMQEMLLKLAQLQQKP